MQPNGDVTNLSNSQLINWFENTYYPNVTTNSENGYYTNYHVRAVPSENCEYEFVIYTIGETTPLPFIKKDTPYQLERGDSLYINYVDNSDRTLNYEYLCDDKGQYKVLLNGVEDLSENSLGFQGIIKANFDLYPSDMYKNVGAGHSYSKTEGYSFDKTIVPGMFSLLNTEEIVIKGFSSGAMKQKSYIYWMANNNNTLTFKLESTAPEKGFYKYSYILNDNEFLFYTDQSKSYLTTLGSGTKLEL
jgi:hypothetical protein